MRQRVTRVKLSIRLSIFSPLGKGRGYFNLGRVTVTASYIPRVQTREDINTRQRRNLEKADPDFPQRRSGGANLQYNLAFQLEHNFDNILKRVPHYVGTIEVTSTWKLRKLRVSSFLSHARNNRAICFNGTRARKGKPRPLVGKSKVDQCALSRVSRGSSSRVIRFWPRAADVEPIARELIEIAGFTSQ